jgi:putative NIF3 family GTP cyclohydrolase 1 type 2
VGEIGKQHQEKETKIEIVYPFYLETQVVKALVKHHPYEEVAYDIFTMENIHLGIGSGVVGQLESPMEEQKFLNLLKELFAAKGIRYTRLLGKQIQKVAVCGGSGSFLLKKAISVKADIYITGDVKYHEFFDAEGKIVLADIGHYESEQFTVELISDLLLKKFPTFAVLKSSVNTNPVNYLV